jgi:ABC-type transport system involved in multi-copper enzyme maturation permease subunit
VSAAHAFRIARHEWRLILKEPRFLLPFLITPLLVIGIQAFAVYVSGSANAFEALTIARSLMMMLAVITPSLAVPLGADSFAGERERNTLEILLCLPVGPLTLFWGKVLGILPLPILIGWLGQGILLSVLSSRVEIPPAYWEGFLRAFALAPAVALFFGSLAAFISMGSETVRGAAQLCSLAMLVVFGVILSSTDRLYAGGPFYGAVMAALLGGSALCLLLARRRFLRLP